MIKPEELLFEVETIRSTINDAYGDLNSAQIRLNSLVLRLKVLQMQQANQDAK